MKEFFTADDVEDLAQQGIGSFALGPDTILTDMARERARVLGIKFGDGKVFSNNIHAGTPSKAPLSASVQDRPTRVQGRDKPAGCLHRHIEGSGPAFVRPAAAAPQARSAKDDVLDQLVTIIRQSGRQD